MRRRASKWTALVFGTLCALCVFGYIQSLEAEYSQNYSESGLGPQEVTEVYVAKEDILPGQRLTDQNCEMKRMQSSTLPESFLVNFSDYEYEGVTTPIFAGQVVTSKHFETSLKRKITVPGGYVAISVPAQDVAAVGAQVSTGDHVDVYSTSAEETVLLLKGALVLETSVESDSYEQGDLHSPSLSWITLAVMPDIVSDLIALSHKSELYFVISSVNDGPQTEGGRIHESTNINLS